MYKEQMLANYQVKRSESNNFGNFNNDYSRFSDNNIINVNQKNQHQQIYEFNSNNRNNSGSHNQNNTYVQQNEHKRENPIDDYNNNQFYKQQPSINNPNSGNTKNNNNNKNNLRINNINCTDRSFEFANDKSVLFSPHFNQVNNHKIAAGTAQYQQNPNTNLNSNANAHLNEGINAKNTERETPNRKGI